MRRIDELFLKHPFYGARQMVRHLRLEGVRIGRRRASRLMRLMGLQAICRAPRTSDPHPEQRVYPYLLKGMSINRSNRMCCNFQKEAGERWVGSTGRRLMQPPRTVC